MSLYFTMGRPFPPQNCPFPWGIWTPSNTWFPRPTRVLNPNGISIGSAVLGGLTSVTNRQTDRPRYSVGNNRPVELAAQHIATKNIIYLTAPRWWLVHGGARAPSPWAPWVTLYHAQRVVGRQLVVRDRGPTDSRFGRMSVST